MRYYITNANERIEQWIADEFPGSIILLTCCGTNWPSALAPFAAAPSLLASDGRPSEITTALLNLLELVCVSVSSAVHQNSKHVYLLSTISYYIKLRSNND